MTEKSLCSFVRRQMKMKGRTWHTGRGFYVCEVDDSKQEDVYSAVKTKLEVWKKKGLIKNVEDGEECIKIFFNNDDHKYGYYGLLTVPKKTNRFFCFNAKWMVCCC